MNSAKMRSDVPIDRGWAWVVVAGAFMNLVLLVGIGKCFGILFAELMEIYQGTASETSTMLALSAGLNLFLAPLITTLSDIYTARVVSMIGGIICALGFLIPAFCTSLEQIIVSFGILTGLGYGICLTPSTIIVGRYFDRRRSLANGLMFSGSGVGGMVVPLFFNYILQHYGLHGAFIILAGFALQTSVFSSLYRPLEYWTHRKSSPVKRNENFQESLDIEEQSREPINRRRQSSSGIVHRVNENSLRPHGSISRLPDQNLNNGNLQNLDPHIGSNMTLYFSAVNLATWLSVPELCDNSAQTENADRIEEEENSEPIAQSRSVWRNFFRRACHVKAADGSDLPLFDLRLLGNVRFSLFVISCMFVLSSLYITMIIPPHCLELGMTKTEVALLLSAQGGADTAGRLLSGFLGDKPFVRSRRKSIAAFCCVICAVTTFASVLLTNFWSLMAYLVVCSVATGSFIASIPVVLVDLVGIENLSRAWGLTVFVEGFSVTFSPVIIGVLRDWTLVYTSGLIFIGVCSTLAVICILIVVILDLRRPTNEMVLVEQ